MPPLYDEEEDQLDNEFGTSGFKVNEGFAEKYESKKRTEELSKCILLFPFSPPSLPEETTRANEVKEYGIVQDKYGKDYQFGDAGDSEEDSEDLSDDDEDAEFVTPQVDAAILRTLARIKAKDPAVYEADRDVFEGAAISISLHFSLTLDCY